MKFIIAGKNIEVTPGLKSAVGYIRRELAHRINLRNTPELLFVLDQSIEYGVNMSKLIDDVTKQSKPLQQDETETRQEETEIRPEKTENRQEE